MPATKPLGNFEVLGFRRRGFSSTLNPLLGALAQAGRFPTVSGDTSSAFSYSWDALAADYIVDPARVTDGTGSEASPFQPSQVLSANGTGGTAVNPNGQRVIFEWIPGNLDYTDPRAGGDKKYPHWRPAQGYGGTSSAPVIHRARYKAGDPAVSSSNYTSIRKTGGAGSLIGVGHSTNNVTDVYFDGFNVPTWTGAAGTQSEVFQYSVWNASRARFVRGRIDGENAGAISVPSNNFGGVYHQNTTDCELADSLVQNIGSASGTQIWSGIEHYSCVGLLIHNNDLNTVKGQGIFEKGETTFQNSGNRYYRNRIWEIRGNNAALFQYVHTTGTTLANASWWYQNLVRDCNFFFKTTDTGVPLLQSGVVVANNTVARMANFGMYFKPITHDPTWVIMNNVFWDCIWPYYAEDGGPWSPYGDNIETDRNRHFGNTGAMNDNGTRTLQYIRDTHGMDVNGQESDPGFFDATNNDFRRSYDQLGTDYLSLLGGATSAAINQGCYITSDQSDQIGRRF